MQFRWALFCWQVRNLVPVSLTAAVLSCLFVLITREPLRFAMLNGPTPYFILVHCLAITWCLGRVRSRSFAFLYGQGFTRDSLWLHAMLATCVSVLAAWLPAAVLIWSGLRSGFQDQMQNYWFPLMAETESAFLYWSLLSYVVLLPILHYGWIRAAQPMRGTTGGFAIAIATVFAAFSIWNSIHVHRMPIWIVVLLAGGFVVAAVSLAWGGRSLHRRLEVV